MTKWAGGALFSLLCVSKDAFLEVVALERLAYVAAFEICLE